jgi:flagellar motor switch protein FliN/FliY
MTHKETGVWERFTSDFGAEVAALLGERTGGVWRTEVASDEATEAPSLKYAKIRFDGSLRGVCYVALSDDQISGLIGATAGDETRTDRLVEEMLTAAATRLCRSRSSAYGVSRVYCDIADPTTDIETSLRLELSDKDNAKVAFLVSADTQLLQTLSVKRAAADSAQLAAVQSLFEMLPDPANLDVVMEVELDVTVRFGQRQLTLREVLDLSSGSVVELDRQVDEPVELLLDGRVIARGEAVVIDGNYGLRVTEVPHALVSRLSA